MRGVIQKTKFLSIFFNGNCANNVETSKDKILSAEGTLQEMYRQKPLYDLSLI